MLFVGSGLTHNPYFNKKHFPYEDISSASISGKNPLVYMKGIAKILWGMVKSFWIICRFKPHVVVGFGSYQTVPAILTAKMLSKPIVLHESNAVPGRVNRILSPYVTQTAVQFSEAGEQLKGSTIYARMPLKRDKAVRKVTREEALEHYQLKPDRLTLLIFGGSQGAKILNQMAFEAILETVISKTRNFQVLHFLGKGADCKKFALSYERLWIPSVVKHFEENMEYAWTLADVLLSRAGAASIAEQVEYGVPGILIPFPYATENHQAKNAESFIEKTGGAIQFVEKSLCSERLGEELATLLIDTEKRNKMRDGIIKYRDSRKCETLISLVRKLMID